ncbi:MAG: mechanosensitive ion channel family protein [Saprospiraceae bacterium]
MNDLLTNIKPWMLSHGIKILFILVGGYLINRLSGKFIAKTVRIVVVSDKYLSKEAEVKREDTLIRIVGWAASIFILMVAAMMILKELEVPIGPLLASAGIIGIAVGFGGQYLIRDLISGIFIILENQYRIGDSVNFDGTKGTVEDISLRMTTLRDLDGTVHHIPNGDIKRVANLSKDFARVNLNISVAYHSDLDHVIQIINKVGHELAEDPRWKAAIIKEPQYLRVDSLGESSIEMKILGETFPLNKWEVMGELRKRLKQAFDKEGIEIPFPQVVIHTKNE